MTRYTQAENTKYFEITILVGRYLSRPRRRLGLANPWELAVCRRTALYLVAMVLAMAKSLEEPSMICIRMSIMVR